jgi:hypothetical protein
VLYVAPGGVIGGVGNPPLSGGLATKPPPKKMVVFGRFFANGFSAHCNIIPVKESNLS